VPHSVPNSLPRDLFFSVSLPATFFILSPLVATNPLFLSLSPKNTALSPAPSVAWRPPLFTTPLFIPSKLWWFPLIAGVFFFKKRYPLRTCPKPFLITTRPFRPLCVPRLPPPPGGTKPPVVVSVAWTRSIHSLSPHFQGLSR